MYLGAIAARVQATLFEAAEDFVIEDTRENLFELYN